MQRGLVIVGSGEAGARAAMALRDQGYDGRLMLIGDEPSGVYERPPLSKAVLTGEVEAAPVVLDRTGAERRAIGLETGTVVVAIDRPAHEVVLADGRRLGYDRLLLATGARARQLPVASGAAALTLRTDRDAAAIGQRLRSGARVGIVGGGFIGLEVAASAVARGCKVCVVELAPRLMGRAVPGEVAAMVQRRHQARGIDIVLGTGVERITPFGMVLSDGRDVACDLVIAGIGALPETGLAAAAGLAVDNGVACDACLRTTDPDIFAAGDCCSFPHPLFGGRRIRLEAWRNAVDQADLVATNMLGAAREIDAVPWFWSDQHDLGLQIAGLVDAAATSVRREFDGGLILFGLDAGGRLVSAAGVAPGNRIARDIRLAEMLIARKAAPEPALLVDPAFGLKKLLKS